MAALGGRLPADSHHVHASSPQDLEVASQQEGSQGDWHPTRPTLCCHCCAFACSVVFHRPAAIVDKAFDIDPNTLDLKEIDLIEAQASEQDLEFVNQVKHVLVREGQVGKGDLLNAAGYAKDDKTARARLEKYDGIYWKSSKRHTRIFYQLL